MKLNTFSAFKSRNYRLFFAGQSISLMGTWMQKTAVSWVIYSQTHSKFMLGASVFATLFPSAIFSPFGGVVSDRYDRHRVLLLTQILSMLQAILLTVLVYFKPDAVWGVITLSVLLGIINGFDVPARQSLVYELVDNKSDLPNALALNSSMVNLSKLIGPAMAGIAIERLGEVVCFGLNAVSFIAVITSVSLITLPAFVPKQRTKNILGDLREGLVYMKETPSIRFITMMLLLVCLLALPFTSLLPVYARDIFHGTASTFGLLDSAVGLGAFIGAIFLASLKPSVALSKVLAINTIFFGAGLIMFSHTHWYPVALFFLVITAFGMMSQVTVSNTLLQTQVAPAMRGRVISLYVMAYTSALPLGSLLVGSMAQHIGVQTTVLVEGIAAIALGGIHFRHLKTARKKKPTIEELPIEEPIIV